MGHDDFCLIIIDVQVGIFTLKQPVYQAGQFIEKIRSLLGAAHNKGITVVFTQHENKTFLQKESGNWKIVHELAPEEDDIIITKSSPSIFKSTNLETVLKERKISKLIICGLITNGCIQQACMEAIDKGFSVTLAGDGHSTYNKNSEKLIKDWNKKMKNQGVKVTDVNDLITEI